MPENRLLHHNPHATPSNILKDRDSTLPSWVKTNAPATILTDEMEKPRRGTLVLNDDNIWHFHMVRGTNRTPIPLPNLHEDIFDMIKTSQLTRGHPPFHRIFNSRRQLRFENLIARHISAASLDNVDAPTLLNLQKLSPNDKKIWKDGYDEEYYGLKDLPAWTSINESEYQKIKHIVGHALPTMAISTVKYDENNQPKRVKWRIVALGNLDPNQWSTNDCFAPVISMVELRFLVSLAIHHRRPLRSGDVKQAFVQATLPDNEQYVLRPPAGCPNTPKNTYWLLKRTLYGLKRSPKHWFVKATKLLAQCGMYPTQNNPCIFKGSPDGKNVMYLGLYVDDFIYFSLSRDTEIAFEQRLKQLTSVDFMGEVSHFIGIKFSWQRKPDNHISVHMTQEAFADNLIDEAGLADANPVTTPYRSGHPVDNIPSVPHPLLVNPTIKHTMQSLVGSLLWLSGATRPDLATIVSLLGQHTHHPTLGHIRAVKYVIRYLKGTKNRGISFSSEQNMPMSAFLKFPVNPSQLLPLCDANWGGPRPIHPRSQQTSRTPPICDTVNVRFYHYPEWTDPLGI